MEDRPIPGLPAPEIARSDAVDFPGPMAFPLAEAREAHCRQLDALKAELAACEARWSALYQIATRLTQRVYSGDVLSEIVRHGMDLLQGDYGVLTELDSPSPEAPAGAEPMLVVRVALNRQGPPPMRVGTRLRPGEGLTGLAIQTGQVQVVDAYHRWAQRVEVRLAGIQTAIAAPLFGRRGPIGALGIAVQQEGRRFSDADIQTLILFAQQAAAVLEAIAGRRAEQELLLQAERRRLAQELHDGFQQRAAALLLMVDRCQAALGETHADVCAGLEAIAIGLQALMHDARETVRALYGSRTDDCNLAESLHQLIARRAADTGMAIRLEVAALPPERLTWQSAQAILRFVREALTNAEKHAHARQMVVVVERLAGGRVRLSVSDDGQGAEPARVWRDPYARGFGLFSLREQIEALGGRFGLDSAPQAGLTVWAEIPIPEAASDDSNSDRG